ncbi:CCCH zinc finger domain protein [Penicillium chermesinum]|uniref:CCCH zinc finger domain protein n=1 Tax=Penicillium chermesinum TaxID=63820 RepID=A0A9W9NI54_9EURO|nr:CCCH zinc finger domain protein [Penicillium chermesinum]KAJ5220424.1 CCCH zinc finger domain protein [Penicillium chermesinum]KAJ6157863.1 CCCH zinc finger domain protein [Penicillium chermesinum]
MTICKYFQQGRCRYGDGCRYEHPGSGNTVSSGNRFGALSGGFGGQTSVQTPKGNKLTLNVSDIKADLTEKKNRPDWIFSSYAPAPDVPRLLFGGPQREQSMEEMRLRHYEATAAGNMDQAVQEAQALWQESMKQMEVALNDTQGAIKYILDGFQEHPNRIDICEGNTGPNSNQSGPAPFSQAQQSSGSTAFNQPASVGFGQPAQSASPFGQPQQPGFGQPSALGSGTAFGQPSSLGGGGGFGKPGFGTGGSAFGTTNNASSFGSTPFGQPSAASASPFGGASTASPFSQINQNANPSPFSNPSATQANPSPFGQPSQPSAFGQPSALGSGSSPFGQAQKPAAAASPFGQASGASGFGQAAQSVSPFGQVQPQQNQLSNPSPFGQPQASTTTAFGGQPTSAAPFGQTAAPQGIPVESNQNAGPPAFMDVDETKYLNPLPRLQGETRRDPASNRLTMWKGRPDNKTWIRIHFPDGPPDPASLRDSQAKEDEYTPEIAAKYEYFLKHGHYENGEIPAVPPKREWISFDF